MMTTDGLSHKVLSDLKNDIDELKKKFSQPDAKASELILEIESLKDSIHELTIIFQKALEEMKGEDLSAAMKEKMDALLSQNETIARGMVAISDKIEETMRPRAMPAMMPTATPMVKHSFGMPEMPERMAPKPMSMTETMPETHLPPPPPPRMEKRRGLFH